MDRFDLRIEVPPVSFQDLNMPAAGEASACVAARVAQARDAQTARYADHTGVETNADVEGAMLEEIAEPDTEGKTLLGRVAEKFQLSARGYHRILRVGRTIADLEGSSAVRRPHVAEAVGFRLTTKLSV